jgi:hypothetical protein
MKSYKEYNQLNEADSKKLFYDKDAWSWHIESSAVITLGTKGVGKRDLVGVMEIKGQTKQRYLFSLNQLDNKYVRGVILKKEEKIYRWASVTSEAGKLLPFVKVNTKTMKAYFLDNDTKDDKDPEKLVFDKKDPMAIQMMRLVYTEDPGYQATEE